MLSTIIVSLVLGFLLAIGTGYGYKIHNIFFTKNITDVKPARSMPGGIEPAVPKTEYYYPSKNKCTAYSGFPLSTYSKCATNIFLDDNHLGMKCSIEKWGQWAILFNWAILSIVIYTIIRILSHKKLNRN